MDRRSHIKDEYEYGDAAGREQRRPPDRWIDVGMGGAPPPPGTHSRNGQSYAPDLHGFGPGFVPFPTTRTPQASASTAPSSHNSPRARRSGLAARRQAQHQLGVGDLPSGDQPGGAYHHDPNGFRNGIPETPGSGMRPFSAGQYALLPSSNPAALPSFNPQPSNYDQFWQQLHREPAPSGIPSPNVKSEPPQEALPSGLPSAPAMPPFQYPFPSQQWGGQGYDRQVQSRSRAQSGVSAAPEHGPAASPQGTFREPSRAYNTERIRTSLLGAHHSQAEKASTSQAALKRSANAHSNPPATMSATTPNGENRPLGLEPAVGAVPLPRSTNTPRTSQTALPSTDEAPTVEQQHRKRKGHGYGRDFAQPNAGYVSISCTNCRTAKCACIRHAEIENFKIHGEAWLISSKSCGRCTSKNLGCILVPGGPRGRPPKRPKTEAAPPSSGFPAMTGDAQSEVKEEPQDDMTALQGRLRMAPGGSSLAGPSTAASQPSSSGRRLSSTVASNRTGSQAIAGPSILKSAPGSRSLAHGESASSTIGVTTSDSESVLAVRAASNNNSSSSNGSVNLRTVTPRTTTNAVPTTLTQQRMEPQASRPLASRLVASRSVAQAGTASRAAASSLKSASMVHATHEDTPGGTTSESTRFSRTGVLTVTEELCLNLNETVSSSTAASTLQNNLTLATASRANFEQATEPPATGTPNSVDDTPAASQVNISAFDVSAAYREAVMAGDYEEAIRVLFLEFGGPPWTPLPPLPNVEADHAGQSSQTAVDPSTNTPSPEDTTIVPSQVAPANVYEDLIVGKDAEGTNGVSGIPVDGSDGTPQSVSSPSSDEQPSVATTPECSTSTSSPETSSADMPTTPSASAATDPFPNVPHEVNLSAAPAVTVAASREAVLPHPRYRHAEKDEPVEFNYTDWLLFDD